MFAITGFITSLISIILTNITGYYYDKVSKKMPFEIAFGAFVFSRMSKYKPYWIIYGISNITKITKV